MLYSNVHTFFLNLVFVCLITYVLFLKSHTMYNIALTQHCGFWHSVNIVFKKCTHVQAFCIVFDMKHNILLFVSSYTSHREIWSSFNWTYLYSIMNFPWFDEVKINCPSGVVWFITVYNDCAVSVSPVQWWTIEQQAHQLHLCFLFCFSIAQFSSCCGNDQATPEQ